jgi:hypothetical protein
MPFYCVLLHGEGIRISTPVGERPVVGFYISRGVWARSETHAREKAISSVQALWAAGTHARANRGLPPRLTVESCEVVGFTRWLSIPKKGHTFYPEEKHAA